MMLDDVFAEMAEGAARREWHEALKSFKPVGVLLFLERMAISGASQIGSRELLEEAVELEKTARQLAIWDREYDKVSQMVKLLAATFPYLTGTAMFRRKL
jgi:hypothetical protein